MRSRCACAANRAEFLSELAQQCPGFALLHSLHPLVNKPISKSSHGLDLLGIVLLVEFAFSFGRRGWHRCRQSRGI